MSLTRLNAKKSTGYSFFRNPPQPKLVTLSLAQKEFDYFGKCNYFWSDYYEWGQYLIYVHMRIIVLNFIDAF